MFFKLFKIPKSAQQVCIFHVLKCVEAPFIKTLKLPFILVKTHGFRMGAWWSPGARLGLKNREVTSDSDFFFWAFLFFFSSFELSPWICLPFQTWPPLPIWNRKRVDEFLHLKIYNSTPNFTKVWFFMYCSFHLKLCIFSTYTSSKIMYNPR